MLRSRASSMSLIGSYSPSQHGHIIDVRAPFLPSIRPQMQSFKLFVGGFRIP